MLHWFIGTITTADGQLKGKFTDCLRSGNLSDTRSIFKKPKPDGKWY